MVPHYHNTDRLQEIRLGDRLGDRGRELAGFGRVFDGETGLRECFRNACKQSEKG